MKLIVGLGNPGKQYESTRHNVGFDAVNLLGRVWDITLKGQKFDSWHGSGMVGSHKVVLIKPLTFMNRSGRSVAAALTFYKILPGDVMVIVDDMALEPGRIRLRPDGSAGGHNGLKDIIGRLGTQTFCRLRIGIGPSPFPDASGYVLSAFDTDQRVCVDAVLDRVPSAMECWLDTDIHTVMTRFNAGS